MSSALLQNSPPSSLPSIQLPQLKLKWNDYIPHHPTPKQAAFLLLNNLEAFFGGAASGGKSDALLMGALQYVDVPNYSAILFRRTFTDLKLASSLISRAHEWLSDTDAKWRASEHCFYFPSGARLAFGHMGDQLSHLRYQSAEYQFIGFDELSQFTEEQYLYLFSRLRRKKSIPVPIRMRAASNPGAIWVKDRFRIEQDPSDPDRFIGLHPKRPFIPALIHDNPHVVQDEYIRSLQNLDRVTRDQLLKGDWSVLASSRFKRGWLHHYSITGNCHDGYFILGRNRSGPSHHRNTLFVFSTVDPAASIREGPGDRDIWIARTKAPAWTVISTWGCTHDNHLLLLDVIRFQREIPDILDAIHATNRTWRPTYFVIESNGVGKGVFQMCLRDGLPVRDLHTHFDKLVSATDAINRMEQGRIWFPQEAPFLKAFEDELFTWTGHPGQPCDQIDTLSNAARIVSERASFTETVIRSEDELPTAIF